MYVVFLKRRFVRFPYWFVYEEKKLEVFHTVEIGTKGKYEPVDCVGESVRIKDEM